MRYLALCLLALLFCVNAHAQEIEPDGTLLSPSLGLPQNLLSLPLFGAISKPTAPKPVAVAKPVLKPVAAPAKKPSTTKTAAKPAAKPTTSSKTTKPAPKVSAMRSLGSFVLKSTAYNSHPSQTDRTPFITATGARTRFGVIALSRDMLRSVPYGSLVRIEDMGSWASGRGRGQYNRMLSGVLFQVEDTMHPRKLRTVDVWFGSRSQAIQWGARQVKLTIVRYGRR
jgi:3D (Asp-Asp-Asp) domain-containing protein